MFDRKSFAGYGKDEYDMSIRDDVAKFIYEKFKSLKPKKVLEIGTYLGFSAFVMLSACDECSVISIDKNEENISYAKQNLKQFGNRFISLKADALEGVKSLNDQKFDFIFIDGPKSQYPKYIPYITEMVDSGGVIMADNVNFHGFVNADGKVGHKHRTAVNRIREFIDSMKNNDSFDTEIFDMGDGVLYSVKK